MKKLLLLALMAGTLAGQSAAAVRTFEFSTTIAGLVYNDTYPVQTAPGIVDGSTVAPGDTVTGRFSFDDAGFDWTQPVDSRQPAISLTYTFVKDGSTFSAVNPSWWVSHNQALDSWSFLIGTQSTPRSNPFIHISVNHERPFSWDIDSGDGGGVTMAWSRPDVNVLFMSRLTGLSEVGVSPVPEPSTQAVLLIGAAVVAGAAKRRAARAG